MHRVDEACYFGRRSRMDGCCEQKDHCCSPNKYELPSLVLPLLFRYSENLNRWMQFTNLQGCDPFARYCNSHASVHGGNYYFVVVKQRTCEMYDDS